MDLKISYPILAFVALVLVIPGTQVVFAQSSQTSSTVSLQYLNIQATYASQVLPGDSVVVHVQANAKSSIELLTLTAQVYYADGSSLRQLVTTTLASDSYVSNGNSISKDIQVTVPQDAPRTSLFALFSENVQSAYYGYSYYYPAGYGYYSNYSYSCNNYYCDFYTYYPSYYVSPYDYSSATDSGVSSLSYIKATTPEYSDLQSQYQIAQQQLAQSQAQNQQLQQKLQDAQNTNAQQSTALSNMNQQLDTARTMITTWETISLALAAAVIILGALSVYLSRRRNTINPEKVTVNQQ
jgi:hypothetical protein